MTARALLLAAALALLALARPALAQTVRGELVERGSGRPIPGALVLLLDARGARANTALTRADGRFTLRAPRAGTYTLRAERVGFRSVTSAPLALGVDQTVAYRLQGDEETVSLRGITARSGRRCRARPGSGQATAVLWEEARKAIAATAHAAEERLLRYDLQLFERETSPAGLVVADERRQVSGQARTPFHATGVDTLARHGFVRVDGDSLVYDAPDAQVLLSDEFLEHHCFRVEESAEHPGWIGLAFEPVRARRVAEVAGVLWLERATAELKLLQYRYVRLPGRMPDDAARGRVEFERLPTGQWIVRRWAIRMPQYALAAAFPELRGARGPAEGAVTTRLLSVREAGGEVASASIREAAAAGQGPRVGRVTGVVWDSVAGRPLAGARVYLSGTGWADTTDAEGRFELPGVAEGRYTLSYGHPALAHWGATAAPALVEVRPDTAARAELGLPSLTTLAATHCTPEDLRWMECSRGVVMGVVTVDGVPRRGVRVRYTYAWKEPGWTAVSYPYVEVDTDENGFYAACRLPTGMRLRLQVRHGDGIWREQVIFHRLIARYDIRVPANVVERAPGESRR
ncbi:MAG TPA: carboxypeptidase regulatory-like domain-containing protein [Longimicrobium sp.]|jgi:hypothetical protein